jgi:N-acetylneuraminic acid mutarotase
MLARGAIAGVVALAATTAIVFAASGGDAGAPADRATDSWAALAPSPLQRTEVGAARVGDRIYVVGGFISSGGTTGRMVRYDISANRWAEVAPLPISVNHPGVAALDRRVYVYGGNLPQSQARERKSDRLYRYNPKRDRWTRLADAPTERAAMALVGIGDRLYAAGGYTETDFDVRALEIYDTERDRWTRGAKMPTGRNHVGAARLKRTMVVTGGRPGDVNGGLTTVESYDPGRDRWSVLPPLATARSGHAAVAVGGLRGGRIVVLGGEELGPGGTTIEQVELFDPRVGGWTALPDMLTPRHGLGGVAGGKRVYALEGGPQPGLAYSGSLEFLDLP